MNSAIRNLLVVATGAASLGLASASLAASQAHVDAAREKQQNREERREQAREQAAPRAQPQQRQAPPAQTQGAAPQQRDRGRGPDGNRGNSSGDANRGDGNRGDSGATARGNLRGVAPAITANVGRNLRDGNRGNWNDRDRNDRGNWNNRGGRDNDRNYRRPPRVVNALPHGYRNYNWNGRPYYSYGGSWYRPYGGSYISIGIPYGLFVSTLPGYHSSFWYGSTRYYYSDDTYYVYEPVRRGYVVSRSPYNDDAEEDYGDDAVLDEDLYVYPARGQSDQQQADDRYECHRWAADEVNYDPIEDEYDPDERAEYKRAMTACLTGRGYSVR